MKIIRFGSKKLEKIYNRGAIKQARVEERVKKIIDDRAAMARGLSGA